MSTAMTRAGVDNWGGLAQKADVQGRDASHHTKGLKAPSNLALKNLRKIKMTRLMVRLSVYCINI